MSSSPASSEPSALLASRPSSAIAPPKGFFPGHDSFALVAQQQAFCFGILYLSQRFVLAVAQLYHFADGVLQPLLKFIDHLFAVRHVTLQALGLLSCCSCFNCTTLVRPLSPTARYRTSHYAASTLLCFMASSCFFSSAASSVAVHFRDFEDDNYSYRLQNL
jgi:hypothetical protein